MYCAASKGNIEIIHLLLQLEGIDINMRKDHPQLSTPLHGIYYFIISILLALPIVNCPVAAYNGHGPAVAMLLIYGANTNLKNTPGFTARAEAKKEAIDAYHCYEEKGILGLFQKYPQVAEKVESHFKPKLSSIASKPNIIFSCRFTSHFL